MKHQAVVPRWFLVLAMLTALVVVLIVRHAAWIDGVTR